MLLALLGSQTVAFGQIDAYCFATNKIDDAGGLVIGKLDDVGKSGPWKQGDHTLNLPPV